MYLRLTSMLDATTPYPTSSLIMENVSPEHCAIDDSALQEQCHKLGQPGCEDREAKLQVFCESLWDRLEHTPRPPETLLSAFLALLTDDDDLRLVQLVLPDLRPAATTSANALKRDLVCRFQGRQPLFEIPHSHRQTHDTEAHRQFEEEKRVLQDAELYRASILLCGHGNTNEAHKERVRQWLLGFPKEDV